MNAKEKVKFWTVPQLPQVELLHATYINHAFDKHIHDGFAVGVIEDRELAENIRHLHLALEEGGMPGLQQESLLLLLLTKLISRHSQEPIALPPAGRENQAVRLAQDYIESEYQRNITLKELATLCHISPFHLLRVFKNSIGVPPHVYLKQVRIRRAKNLLAKNLPMSFVAQEAGFSDQSHFAKQFKKITGLTPKKYSNIIQEKIRP